MGEPVPDADVARALAEVNECLGADCDLDALGWSAWFAADEDEDGRFACAGAGACGPVPADCKQPSDCPCRCHGISLYGTRQIVVSSGAAALKHEILHVCTGVRTHDDPEIWKCQ